MAYNKSIKLIVSTYQGTIAIVEGNGRHADGWPIIYDKSLFKTSPLLYDYNKDGVLDILAIDVNGRIHWIIVDENLNYIQEYVNEIPKLPVTKDR